MTARISKRVEFDYGHRLLRHKSKCRNLHGHRGVLRLDVEGDVIATEGSDKGMVLDFGDLKRMLSKVADHLDHAFIVERADAGLVVFLAGIPGHRTVVVDFPPTAENLAAWIAQQLQRPLKRLGWITGARLRFYETPTSWAEVTVLG